MARIEDHPRAHFAPSDSLARLRDLNEWYQLPEPLPSRRTWSWWMYDGHPPPEASTPHTRTFDLDESPVPSPGRELQQRNGGRTVTPRRKGRKRPLLCCCILILVVGTAPLVWRWAALYQREATLVTADQDQNKRSGQ